MRIAQIEAASKTESFGATDVTEIVGDVAELFEPIADDRSMPLTVAVPPIPTEIIGDRELLTQLVVNLVENALAHCPAQTEIGLSVSFAEGAIVLEVSDNGPGIDPSIRHKVLERFFQSEGSRSSGGNGLGLALVKAIADIHGAEIEILSNAPGTRVRIRFPRSDGQDARPPAVTRASGARSQTELR